MGATGQSAKTQTTPGQASDDEEAVLCAMQLANAASLPMVLKVALEFDILEIMARSCPAGGGLISPAEIAAQLPTSNVEAPAMLDRILRLLASYSILTCKLDELPGGKVERLYGLAPVCKFLTKNEDGVSLAPLCLMHHDKVHMASWHYLKDAILEGGIAFDKAHGVNAFDYHGTDLRFNQVFNRALFNHSTFFMKKILETYDGFRGLNTVVDLGGGTGAVLRMIVSKYPSIKGINFDLPHVIADATPFPGVEHVPGDMFVSVPKGEAIFMKGICHDWDDEHCLKLLKNCHAALPDDHGKVIVAECILPVCPDPSLATKEVFHFDCMMMTQHGGKERMEDEFEALAKRAGFEGVRVACRVLNKYVMEFIKKASDTHGSICGVSQCD